MEPGSSILQNALQHLPLVKDRQLNNIDKKNAGADSLSPKHKGFRLDKEDDSRNAWSGWIKETVDLRGEENNSNKYRCNGHLMNGFWDFYLILFKCNYNIEGTFFSINSSFVSFFNLLSVKLHWLTKPNWISMIYQ